MLIGAIKAGRQKYFTDASHWSAVRCPDPIPPEWLTDISKGSDQSAKLTDLGGFGDGPAKHMPAEYAGTPARWIWPEVSSVEHGAWLIRCQVNVE